MSVELNTLREPLNRGLHECNIMFKLSNTETFTIDYFRYVGEHQSRLILDKQTFYGMGKAFALVSNDDVGMNTLAGTAFEEFAKKWARLHCHNLPEEYAKELEADIAKLKQTLYIPYIERKGGSNEMFAIDEYKELLHAVPHKAWAIHWETNGETYKSRGLPTSAMLPYGLPENDVTDYLSHKYYCLINTLKLNFGSGR